MKITTIQLQESVKNELEKLKEDPKETYEDVIRQLLREIDKQRRMNKALLIEGYKEMAEESLKICKEFEAADNEVMEKYGN